MSPSVDEETGVTDEKGKEGWQARKAKACRANTAVALRGEHSVI